MQRFRIGECPIALAFLSLTAAAAAVYPASSSYGNQDLPAALRLQAIDVAPRGPQVKISQPYGRRGPTSFRYTTAAERNLKQSPNPADAGFHGGKYWKRDRDLLFYIEGKPLSEES